MQSVRHPNRAREGLRATERALMRWHPGLSLRFIDAIHAKVPDYPLIHGGSPRLVATNNDQPSGPAPRAA